MSRITTKFTRHHGHVGVKRVAMTLRVPASLHKVLRKRALAEKMTITDYVTRLLEDAHA